MELFICIGNLGADAELKTENGKEFVKFNVAETRRWQDSTGAQREETIWNSCIMHGRNEKLLPFLTKGTKVVVVGRGSVRVYSSPKLRQMVAGININVDRLELISVNRDEVDRYITTPDGELVSVTKLFYVDYNIARRYATETSQALFYDRNGQAAFYVDYNGFVTKIKNDEDSMADTSSSSATENERTQDTKVSDESMLDFI